MLFTNRKKCKINDLFTLRVRNNFVIAKMNQRSLGVKPEFYISDRRSNRNSLFKKALECAKDGKILYILHKEFEELPEISQEKEYLNRHFMKMIRFIYVKDVFSLVESISTLPNWQNIPSVIILEGLDEYSPEKKQTACGLVAFLIDTVRSCSIALQKQCQLLISVNKNTYSEDFCVFLKEIYECEITL